MKFHFKVIKFYSLGSFSYTLKEPKDCIHPPQDIWYIWRLTANGNDFNRKETGSSSSRQWLSQCDGVNLKTILSKSIITSPLNALYLVSDVITYTLNKTIKLVFVLNSLLSKVQECCKVFGLLESSRSKVLNTCNDYKVKDTMWFRLTNCIKKSFITFSLVKVWAIQDMLSLFNVFLHFSMLLIILAHTICC